MTEYEAYQEHIRYTHDTYCRIVIRHASFDAARMLAARWKREISLEYLTEEKFVPLSTTDEYFQVPDYGETYPFSVRGQTIFLDSCSLAAALAELPQQTQEEIFLYQQMGKRLYHSQHLSTSCNLLRIEHQGGSLLLYKELSETRPSK